MNKNDTRAPAVAGMFYPADPSELRTAVETHIRAGRKTKHAPRALIAPHAGYIYSGAIAGTAYAQLANCPKTIDRVVVLGPSHRVAFRGMALSSAKAFATPLGNVPVDQDLASHAGELGHVKVMDAAHQDEHGIEVQLPFLQVALSSFTFLPVVVGDATADEVAAVISATWGDQTLIVVSSDLSHYFDYETARRMDAATSLAIEGLRPQDIGFEQACGRLPIQGLLRTAKERALKAHTLDLRNSGDTAGGRAEVVGYGAYVID